MTAAAIDLFAWYGRGILLLALLRGGVMAWTANLGGQIRHSEIRADRGATLDSGRGVSEGPEQGPESND